MTSPYQRNRDRQPIGRGGEIALVALILIVFSLALAALAGLGFAAALVGGGWVWPHGSQTIGHVVGGLLTGHHGNGLPPQLARRVPGAGAVYVCVIAAELLLITLASGGGVVYARYRRPGDARGGMATRAEAEQVLGVSRLRRAKTIIRPDLHAGKRRDLGS
jgi:hypothetical protein